VTGLPGANLDVVRPVVIPYHAAHAIVASCAVPEISMNPGAGTRSTGQALRLASRVVVSGR
jgi:hypothetical protein